mgnify:CR=1 FL=1
MEYYFKAFVNYANFKGRATRKEFWIFMLVQFIVINFLGMIEYYFGLYPDFVTLDYGYLTLIYIFATALPFNAIQIRRLHDVGMGAAWWFVSGMPIVNFYVIYLYCKKGDPNPNSYGYPTDYNLVEEEKQVTLREEKLDGYFTVCVYDEADKSVKTIKKAVDVNKFPPSKYATDGMYYAIDKIRDDKKVRIYCEKDNWKNQIGDLSDSGGKNSLFCKKCGSEILNEGDFCSRCGTSVHL